VEQRDVLRHDADRTAQGILRQVGHALIIDQDTAVLHVVEPLDKADQG